MTATVATLPRQGEKTGLHVALWIAQGLLFLVFMASGIWKTFTPLDALMLKLRLPGELVRFIGVSELAGGLGVLLPSLTRVRPRLTAWAGAGLALIMVLAAGTHLGRAEMGALPINAFLGGLAALVAWGRFVAVPIPARS